MNFDFDVNRTVVILPDTICQNFGIAVTFVLHLFNKRFLIFFVLAFFKLTRTEDVIEFALTRFWQELSEFFIAESSVTLKFHMVDHNLASFVNGNIQYQTVRVARIWFLFDVNRYVHKALFVEMLFDNGNSGT